MVNNSEDLDVWATYDPDWTPSKVDDVDINDPPKSTMDDFRKQALKDFNNHGPEFNK